MKETQIGSFIELVENAIKEYWDLDALTDYEGATLQYKDVARKIEKLHIIFNEAGIEKRGQDCGLRQKQFAMGCCFFGSSHIRSCSRAYSARIYSRADI